MNVCFLNVRLILGVLALAGLFTGCKATYSEKNLSNEPIPMLRRTSRIYIAVPFDASFKQKVMQFSGKQTADALYDAFTAHTKSVYISKYPESVSEALESARNVNADYLVYPSILKWEDRATEVSGRRDQLQVKVETIDLSLSRVVYSKEITATGKWMSDGGDTPRDLLAEPMQHYVNTLFRRIETPTSLW